MDKLKIYDNGLRLVMKKIDGMYSTAIGIWVGVGSSDETQKNNGISHFIEHMLFKGTTKRSSFDIVNEVDSIGANINAFTSKECTCYYIKSTAEHQKKSMDILSDLLFNSVFDEEEMEREKGVILEEINMVEDLPDDKCLEMLASAYYKDHSLGKTILGTAENVKGFKRQDILDYMSTFYNPRNIVISVCGNIDFDDVEKLTEKYFTNNFKTKGDSIPNRASRNTPSTKYLAAYKDIEQAHIALAFPSVNFNSDKLYQNQILNNIFGGGMSSRLFQSVREKHGLAYTVYSYISTYKDNGYLTIYAGINANNLDKAVKTIKDEINILIEKGVTEEEFLRGREQLKGALVLSQESTSAIMNAYGKYLIMADRLYNLEARLDEISKITLQDVNDCIKKTYDLQHVCAAYVGKKNHSKDILELLKN